jgi:hypothetical protein
MSEVIDNTGQLPRDSHDLGEFQNIYDAMERYPNGGRLGDYITIFGVRHYWNEDRLSWGILEDVDESVIRMVEDMLNKLAVDGYAPNWLVFVFRQSEEQPPTPTGTEKYPAGWLAQTGDGDNWWISTGIIRGATGDVIAWSVPIRFSGKAANEGVLVFKQWPVQPDRPTGSGLLPEGWLSGPTNPDGLWWMSKGDYNGVTKQVTGWSVPVRVSGMDGDTAVTLETIRILVGDEGVQFRFVNSKTNPAPVNHSISYNADTYMLSAAAGIIQHMTLGITELRPVYAPGDYRYWDVTAYNSPAVTETTKGYYLYARCSKSNETGTFLLSETTIKLEEVAGYFHLLVGILSRENNGERTFTPVYGLTEIRPGQITTDKIASTDGETWFDLLQGIIAGRIKFISSGGELKDVADADDLAAEALDAANAAAGSASDANSAVAGLRGYVDGAFEDKVITEAEAVAIEKYINVVKATESEVESTFAGLYANPYLSGTPKTALNAAKTAFSAATAALLTSINVAIFDGETTVEEKQDVDAKFEAFDAAYSAMSTAIDNAYKAIQDKLKGYSDAAQSTANEAKNFIDNTLPNTLNALQRQIDNAIESWFYHYDPTLSNIPASEWITDEDREKHLDDTFTNLDDGRSWRFTKDEDNVYGWTLMADTAASSALIKAGQAQAAIDGKIRIFSTPAPPYDEGDLWVEGSTGDIWVCTTGRQTGSFTASDWAKASKYTDDSGLNDFVESVYNVEIPDLKNQLDGKIESWFQTTDPSAGWSAADKPKHAGDMWYSDATKELKRYTGSGWTLIQDQKAIDAYNKAQSAQDVLEDGIRRTFTETPAPPYDEGDLWVDGSDLRMCVNSRANGSYVASDWVLAVDYERSGSAVSAAQAAKDLIAQKLGYADYAALESAAEAGETIIEGGKINTALLEATTVITDAMFAQWLQTTELLAEWIRTTNLIAEHFDLEGGKIGGFKVSGSGLTNDFDEDSAYIIFRYDPQEIFAGIGINIFPATSSYRGVARFENHASKGYFGGNIAVYASAKNGAQNFAVYAANGDIVANGDVTGYLYAALTPAANQVLIPGPATAGSMFNIYAKFTNSGSGIGLPTRSSVATKLGISSTTPFAVDFKVIALKGSTQGGTVYGRNSSVSGMSTTQYPQMLGWNAEDKSSQSISAGDSVEYKLIWDGTNYYAYQLGVNY